MRTRRAHTDRRVRESDLHGLSKTALQHIVKSQIEKWPTLTLGKLTSKTNMATICVALLDQELGFTIRASALEPESQDEGQVQGSSENPSTVEGVATASKVATIDSNVPNLPIPSDDRHVLSAHSSNDRQVLGSSDRDQAAVASAEQPVEGEVTDLSKLEDHCAIPVQSNDVTGATTQEAALDFNEPSPFVLGAGIDFNKPAGPTYSLDDGLDFTNLALLATRQLTCVKGSNHGQPLASNISGCKMPDFPDKGSNFTALDGAGAVTTTVDDTGQSSTGHDCSTAAGVRPFRATYRHTSRSSFVRAKMGPTRKASKTERTKRIVGCLIDELKLHPDYNDFQSTLHHVRDNPGAVKSWKFGVDFLKAHSGVCLVDGEYRKISKLEVSTALGVGKTWLSEANDAVKIVQTYGEGGTHRSQPFIDKITSTAGVPEGRTKLLQWLKTWRDEHPV
ncbi:hypothetical protein H4582DRAFT_2210420 [Lactarius indigo]|nr:hypothetical protein H4582DRAFT_2210420 [Lactarius indigo]